ncbi:MAG TPA: DUF4214 domain-containing protein [Pirellulales bacterium]|jgi:hypothetical protein|nr:DUF4214 domain-containing protein [Pirellulales bacterium]
MLSAGVREEYLLELINQMRTDPADELALLLNSNDPSVINALSYFQVNTTLLAQQWATLTPAAPLAYNNILATTASNHSALMSQLDQQSHQLPGEADLFSRITSAGYPAGPVGENIYAYASDTFDAHAGFAIDWGTGPGGMENPPGHRQNIMSTDFRDVGLGILDGGGPGKSTGPLLVTEDFGAPMNPGNPYLVGAVFAGSAYSLSGEGTPQVTSNGLANVTITAASTAAPSMTFTTTTTAAGGYELQLPAGTYTVTFSGGGLAANVVKTVSVGTDNVLLNISSASQTALPTSSVASLPATSPVSFTVSWNGSDPGGPGIASYDVFVSDNGGSFTPLLTATTATSTTFNGANGHSYGFYSVAVDTAGNRQPTPAAAQATTKVVDDVANTKYVTAVYEDVLGRAPDPGGLAHWVQRLDAGAPISSIAAAIGQSAEYYGNFVIKPDYLKLLGRAADAAGLQYWTTQMLNRLTDEQLEAGFIASDEFFANAGGTDLDWVDAVYTLLLGRMTDASGATYWTNQLASLESMESAVQARSQVAVRIASSQENNSNLINDDYLHYLGRAADPQGLQYWLQQFAAGATNEDVIAGFTGSAEYYKDKTGVNP